MTAAALAWVFGIGFLVALVLLTIAVLGNRDLAAENHDLRAEKDDAVTSRNRLARDLGAAIGHPSVRPLASVHMLPGLDERTETWGGGA